MALVEVRNVFIRDISLGKYEMQEGALAPSAPSPSCAPAHLQRLKVWQVVGAISMLVQ